MRFTAGSGRPRGHGRVRASVRGAHIVDKLDEQVGLGVAEYLNSAPDTAEAVRGVLKRQIPGGIGHPHVELDTGLRVGHARVVLLVRRRARRRRRDISRIPCLIGALASCLVIPLCARPGYLARAIYATEASQVGVGHVGHRKVERRDARGGRQAPARRRGPCGGGACSGGRDQGPWLAPSGSPPSPAPLLPARSQALKVPQALKVTGGGLCGAARPRRGRSVATPAPSAGAPCAGQQFCRRLGGGGAVGERHGSCQVAGHGRARSGQEAEFACA
jgi:hypothetical protein